MIKFIMDMIKIFAVSVITTSTLLLIVTLCCGMDRISQGIINVL